MEKERPETSNKIGLDAIANRTLKLNVNTIPNCFARLFETCIVEELPSLGEKDKNLF